MLHADREPQNWLTYGGGYASQRYSLLNQITRDNVERLTLKWVWRPKYLDKMETTPLVVDGVLYAVQNSEVVALDAATGRSFWTFRYRVPPESNAYLMVVQGPRDLRRPPVLGDLRRAPDRDRREDRQGDLEQDARSTTRRAFSSTSRRSSSRTRSSSGRRPTSSAPTAGSPRSTSAPATEVWRFKTVAGARRARQRDVAGRLVAARRRADLGDRLVRSRQRT